MKSAGRLLVQLGRVWAWPGVFLVPLAVVSAISCTRKVETNSTVIVNLPGISGTQSTVLVATPTPEPSGSPFPTPSTNESWGLPDPSSMSQVNCYVVIVTSADQPSSACRDSDGKAVFMAGTFSPLTPAGNKLSIDVQSGPGRTVRVVGFVAASQATCLNQPVGSMPKGQLSAPRIIGSATRDLEPGIVEMDIAVSLASSVKFNSCDNASGNNPSPSGSPFPSPSGSPNPSPSASPTPPPAPGSFNVSGLTGGADVVGDTWLGNTYPTVNWSVSADATDYLVVIRDAIDTTDVCAPQVTAGTSYNFSGCSLGNGNSYIAKVSSRIGGGPYYAALNSGYSFVVDSVLPTVSLTGYPSTQTPTMNAVFTFTGGDANSGIAKYTCDVNGAMTDPCTSPFTSSSSTEGAYLIYVRSIDNAGNISSAASYSWTVDYTAPVASLSGEPSGTNSITNLNVFVSGAGVVQYEYAVGLGISCGAVGYSAAIGVGTPITDALGPDGAYTLCVRGIDGAGNIQAVGSATSASWTKSSVAPANLVIDETFWDYGNVATGGTATKTFVVQNQGSVTATSMVPGGLLAPFTVSGGTCGASLAAAATCTIIVDFMPAGTGLQSDVLEITYNDGSSPQTETSSLQGTGTLPGVLSISDSDPYDYGTKALGSSTDKTFTVTNSGGGTSTGMNGAGLSGPFTFKGGVYPGTGGTCGAALAAAASCTFIITYSPASPSFQSSTLALNYNDGAGAQFTNKGLQGTGASPATVTISDGPTYDYGTLANGGVADKTFTLNNTGGFAATAINGSGLASPYSFKGGAFPGTGGTCGATLSSGANCTFIVTFAPTSTGSFPDGVDINFNDGAAAQTSSRAVQGTGAIPASLSISDGPTYDYGNRANGSSSDKSFTVTNSGGVSATGVVGSGLAAPFSFKGGSYPGVGGNCGTSIGSGATCTFVVTFSPAGTGAFSDTVDLNYSDGANNQVASRAIQGTGVTPALLSISGGSPFNFGTVPVGNFAENTFTVTNTGQAPATGMSGTALSGAYSYKGGSYPGTGGTCAATLSGSGSCTVVIRVSPGSPGTFNDGFTINYNDGVGAQSVLQNLTAQGMAENVLKIVNGYGEHACALTTMGNVKCWGRNNYGQLGYEDTSNRGSSAGTMGVNLNFVNLGTGMTALDIAVGLDHTCALLNNNQVKCWGRNTYGQLGIGNTTTKGNAAGHMGDNLVAINLGTGRSAMKLSAFADHTCVVLDNAQAKCWGNGGAGRLGQNSALTLGDGAGEMGDSLPAINLGSSVLDISAGYDFTCAILTSGNVKCWGGNSYGQLGQGSTTALGDGAGEMAALTAVNMGAGRTAMKISTGSHTVCAILDDNTVKCWGDNMYGNAGVGTSGDMIGETPGDMGASLLAVSGISGTIARVDVGDRHACAVNLSGNTYCWGQNSFLGLDVGGGSQTTAAQVLNPIINILDVTLSSSFTCAVTSSNVPFCWGPNTYGELGTANLNAYGDGSNSMISLPPVSLAIP